MVEAGNQFRRVNATCTYVPCASPSSSTSRPPMSDPPPTITPSTPSNDQRSATEVDERRTVLTVPELDWILGMVHTIDPGEAPVDASYEGEQLIGIDVHRRRRCWCA